MGLFEFFFPEWAAAEHLRTLAERAKRHARGRTRRRLPSSRKRRAMVGSGEMEKRLEALEGDVGFLSLLVLGILDGLEEKGLVTREDLAALMEEMDALDGAKDGKVNVQILRNLLEKDEDSRGDGKDESGG